MEWSEAFAAPNSVAVDQQGVVGVRRTYTDPESGEEYVYIACVGGDRFWNHPITGHRIRHAEWTPLTPPQPHNPPTPEEIASIARLLSVLTDESTRLSQRLAALLAAGQ